VLLSGRNDNFVNLPVKGVVGQISELIDTLEIIVDLVVRLAVSLVALVAPRQNAGAAGVKPIARVRTGVARSEAGSDGPRGTFVVGGLGRV